MSAPIHNPVTSGASNPHRLLLVGGSFGGLTFLTNFLDIVDGKPCRPTHRPLPDFGGRISDRGVQITVLDERDGFFHTVGAPLAHTAKQCVVPFWKEYSTLKELKHPAVAFAQGRIEEIDPEAKRATYTNSVSGETVHHEYDYIVNATGLSRQWPIVPKSHTKDGYVKDALEHISKLNASDRVVVIGGGAVGIEVSAELKVNSPHIDVTLIHSRDKLLSNEPLPDDFKDRTLLVMKEEGVKVVLGQRATVHDTPDSPTAKRVELADGTVIEAGAVVNATAKCPPNTQALPSSVLDSDGFVKITPTLTFPADSPNSESHFAIGDIVAWPGIKRAGGAMFMGQIAAANIYAKMMKEEDASLEYKQTEMPVYPAMMGLAVGKQAIGYGGPGTEVDFGIKTMETLFGPDLAWTSCLKYMQLSEMEKETVDFPGLTAKTE